MSLRVVDFFAGIGGFRLGLERAGAEVVAACEIADFPRAVYAHHWEEPEHGDIAQINPKALPEADLWCGGFPCQDVSSAGAGRGLLGGRRSGLVFRWLGLAAVARPRWLLMENVPGLLVAGRGFGRLLGVLARLGYGFAWRTLDAQHFGVAQRRRRVFLLACLGARAERVASLLLEPPGLCGDPPARREAREGVARPLAAGSPGGGHRLDLESGALIYQSHANAGVPPAVVSFSPQQVTSPHNRTRCDPGAPAGTLVSGGAVEHVAAPGFVRRLTPTECERLQGFPDGWTAIPGAADGPRYRALGNSVAVPCVEWIARRLIVCGEGVA